MTELEIMEQNMIAWQLIEMGWKPPEETDWDYCLALLEKEAEGGNDRAQLRYGDLFLIGDHVEKNSLKASQWYKKAADQGNMKAKKALRECRPLVVLDMMKDAMSLIESDNPETIAKGFAMMEYLAEKDAENALPTVTDIYIAIGAFKRAREFLNRMAEVSKKHAKAVSGLLEKVEAAAAEEKNGDDSEAENEQKQGGE